MALRYCFLNMHTTYIYIAVFLPPPPPLGRRTYVAYILHARFTSASKYGTNASHIALTAGRLFCDRVNGEISNPYSLHRLYCNTDPYGRTICDGVLGGSSSFIPSTILICGQ